MGGYKYIFESSDYKYQAVGAVIISPSNKVLMLLRNEQSPVWAFPGGGVDEGEDLVTALKREILEELCILPTQYFLTSSNPAYTDTMTNSFPYHNFLVKSPNEFMPKLNHEHLRYAWFGKDEIPPNLHPGVKYFLSVSNLFKNFKY